ncbi:MAG: TonB-dependent receptor plug domain-containing protein [Bacteroidales bacterium]|nr:TonB-dependent receptor plug domain-containing protein [Bacteroidales bacterium]
MAQMPDTTGIYGERRDTLDASVFTSSGNGNFLSKGKDIRTEVITAAGLCKMACCNLAESFENSASVTVGYSDAVTGARQIRLLGQSGIYVQMLDENRPIMRGLSAPWGLNYVPSQWLESIQVAKGVTSVINGVESMTGQINLEHRKPTDEIPLFLQASVMNDLKTDVNLASSIQLDEEGKWSTAILAHANANFMGMDHNGDTFLDDPLGRMFSLANRWLYYAPSGLQVRFGVSGIDDLKNGGQPAGGVDPWTADIRNRSLDAYVKVGVPLNEDNTRNFAVVTDFNYVDLNSKYGRNEYIADQHSAFLNLLYQDQQLEAHHFTLGLSNMFDFYREYWSMIVLKPGDPVCDAGYNELTLNDLGAFAEYTFHVEDKFSAIASLRADWFAGNGLKFSPRLTLKWIPWEQLVLRANGGRGLRYSLPFVDNIGIFSTSKNIKGNYREHPLEDAWTFGGNATWYLPFDDSQKTYISLDYFGTRFVQQMLADYSTGTDITFYTLKDKPGSYSYTNNLQLDFGAEPFRGFTVTLTGRLTDARQTHIFQSDDYKPMTDRYKAVLNLQYATNLNKWIFDFTASLSGPCRVWDFMRGLDPMYYKGWTKPYPLLYAQVTKRFKGFDIYVGGENLTNYTQPNPIIGWESPWTRGFDASCIWGPLMGTRIYAGVRMTIWKTEKI